MRNYHPLRSPEDGGGSAAASAPSPTPEPVMAPLEGTKSAAKELLGLDETPDESLRKLGGHQPTEAKVEPAKPVEAPKPTVPAVEALKPKIKIGNKEYSPEELDALINGKQKPEEPTASIVPKVEEVPLTKEQIRVQERKFVTESMSPVYSPIVDEHVPVEAYENIIIGGEEGHNAFKNLLTTLLAEAHLRNREQSFSDTTPQLRTLVDVIRPLQEERAKLEQIAYEHEFFGSNAHLVPYTDVARQIGEALSKQYPDQVRTMPRADFLNEVKRQTEVHLDRLYKPIGQDWRAVGAAKPTATVIPTPLTALAQPTTPKPQAPRATPLAANLPGITQTTGPVRSDQAALAASLRD